MPFFGGALYAIFREFRDVFFHHAYAERRAQGGFAPTLCCRFRGVGLRFFGFVAVVHDADFDFAASGFEAVFVGVAQ